MSFINPNNLLRKTTEEASSFLKETKYKLCVIPKTKANAWVATTNVEPTIYVEVEDGVIVKILKKMD